MHSMVPQLLTKMLHYWTSVNAAARISFRNVRFKMAKGGAQGGGWRRIDADASRNGRRRRYTSFVSSSFLVKYAIILMVGLRSASPTNNVPTKNKPRHPQLIHS